MMTTKFGVGAGAMTDHGDGTASYRKSGTLGQAFRVRIADVDGFAVSKGGKALERTVKLMGNGTELASVSVGHGVAERIEGWFRAHPDFHGGAAAAPEPTPAAGVSVADELRKLADLRDAGVLTEAEFTDQKAKLLN